MLETIQLFFRRLPNNDDKKTFIKTFYGQKWPTGKTVLVLRIIDADGESDDIWMVVHNKRGSHAEMVLEAYLKTLKAVCSRSELKDLRKCDFVIYINWAPCDKCAKTLRKVFDFCGKGSVCFTGLYTKQNDEDASYANYKGWKMLEEHVVFEYMTKHDYEKLNFTSLTTSKIEESNKKHTIYALNKMPESKMDSVKSFLEKL